MKRKQIFSSMILLWIFISPLLSVNVVADTPDYIGIGENDTIIWKTTIDEDPYEDYLEDDGYSEAAIELIIDDIFDDEYDEDVEGWKIVIMEIRDEKEYDLDRYTYLEDDEYDGVPYLYNLHTTENFEADNWEEEETNEREIIYRYDRDLYALFNMIDFYDIPSAWPYHFLVPDLIVAKNVNWKRVVSLVDEEFEDSFDDAGAKRPETPFMFFFEQDADGIIMYRDLGEDPFYLEDVDEFEATSIYTDNGILRYYELTYDGDPILIFELQNVWENYVIANLWTIAIISAVALVIGVVVVILIKRR